MVKLSRVRIDRTVPSEPKRVVDLVGHFDDEAAAHAHVTGELAAEREGLPRGHWPTYCIEPADGDGAA